MLTAFACVPSSAGLAIDQNILIKALPIDLTSDWNARIRRFMSVQSVKMPSVLHQGRLVFVPAHRSCAAIRRSQLDDGAPCVNTRSSFLVQIPSRTSVDMRGNLVVFRVGYVPLLGSCLESHFFLQHPVRISTSGVSSYVGPAAPAAVGHDTIHWQDVSVQRKSVPGERTAALKAGCLWKQPLSLLPRCSLFAKTGTQHV
ncbi:hypothetical protein IWZ03DRAFT_155467 [Phyllosticta citriasiana]|uniref:Uncharacterized protein n=1 Tax=Phyllosticta citriasiana TaxID=595635 RepID=A0ABR1KP88_9PEZI